MSRRGVPALPTGSGHSRTAPLRDSFSRILERGLRRIAETPITVGNSASLLVDGPRAYPTMLDRIAGARDRIHLENYIIRDDEVGDRFASALVARAREGIRVRVLYDWFGSLGTGGSFWDRLRDAGCETRPFGVPGRGRGRGRRSLLRSRDHRKLLTVDGQAAVLGGLCIGAEWEGESCWRDTAVALEGPIVPEVDRSFARMWSRADGQPFRIEPASAPPATGSTLARVVDGRPRHVRAYRLYQLMATLAEESLLITMAYPLIPVTLRRALAGAAREGVDVRLLVPSRSDVPIVNYAARAHYGSLLRSGVRIYEWEGPMLHAKTAVADRRLALIGSTNLNPFSLLGNYELDVELQDPALGGELHEQFLRDLERSQEILLPRWRRRPWRLRLRERVSGTLLWVPARVYGG